MANGLNEPISVDAHRNGGPKQLAPYLSARHGAAFAALLFRHRTAPHYTYIQGLIDFDKALSHTNTKR